MPQAIGLALGQLLFTLGAPLAVVNFFAIGAGGSLAFGIGASLLNAALRPKAPTITPSDGQIAIRQPVPARMVTYGTRVVAGAVFWFDVDSGELYLGQIVNARRIAGFEAFYIDNTEVEVDGSDNITTSPYSTLSGAKKIITHLGLPTETAYAEIASAFGTTDVRGDELASLLLIIDNFASSEDQLKNFPNGKPQVKAKFAGSLVHDWRDPDQDRDDPSTWAASENPVVVLADYLTTYAGRAWADIAGNLAEWTAAADYCDEPVLSLAAGESQARYRIALSFFLTDAPKNVVAQILATFDGALRDRPDGTLGIAAGRFVNPSVTIADDHIVSVEMTRGQDRLTSIAGVRAQYLSPDHLYREQDAEPWPNGATVAALTDERVANLDLTAVPGHAQARRLMKRVAKRAAAPWRGTVRTTLYGMKAIGERYVRLQIAELQIDATFEVVAPPRLDVPNLQVELEVVAVDASIDDWSPSTEEGDAPAVPAGLVVIDKDAGTRFGDLNDRGGLPAAFNDDRTVDAGDCALADDTTTGYVGKSFSTGKAFGKAIIYGSQNFGFVSSSIGPGRTDQNPTTTITIYGKNGTPANSSDGTSLGSVTFTDTADESGGRTVVSTDTVTTYTHIWAEISQPSGSNDVHVAELDLWEYKEI